MRDIAIMRNKFLKCSSLKWKVLILYLTILGVCVSGCAFNKIFVYVTFAITFISIINNSKYALCQLFFLLPFTVVYKLTPDSSSFFAYSLLTFAIFTSFRQKNSVRCLMVIIPICIYMLLGLLDNPLLWVKMISGWIILACFVCGHHDDIFEHIVVSFSLGLILSSIWGLNKFEIPQIAEYFKATNSEYMNGESVIRFAGLYYDPNYYSVSVIIALCSLLTLGTTNRLNKIVAFTLAGVILFFGALSYSKMFIICAIIVILAQTSNFIVYSKTKWIAILLVIVILFYAFISLDNSTYVNNILYRLESRDLTSGRFDIAKYYIDYLLDNPVLLLLGQGMASEVYGGHTPHNTFIESLYFIGIIGTAIYIGTIYWLFYMTRKKIKRIYKNYLLFFIFIILLSSLSLILMNDMYFYLILLWYSFNYEYNTTVKI